MKKLMIPTFALALLVLAACGDDDGGSASGVQGEAADQLITSAEAGGLALDEDCINQTAAKLSYADAQAIVDAGPDGDADVSAEAEALQNELFNCIDSGAFADLMMDSLNASGMDVDEGCVRDKAKDLDPAALAESGGQPSDDFVTAMLDCVDLTGG
jgi:hypothetical protein